MLSDAEKVNIRRFCWYPAYGNSDSSMSSWRFFTQYGQLEYRLNNLSSAELDVVRSMLVTLTALEGGPSASSNNLDTDKAAVWTHNKNEFRDRINLYNQQRGELVQFLGITPGPAWRGAKFRIVV